MPATHDLLHLTGYEVDGLARAAPPWVRIALARAPFVVVRREQGAPGMVAVGVRGSSRGERFGTWLPASGGLAPITPASLVPPGTWRVAADRAQIPAIGALAAVGSWLTEAGWTWGPCGSVGFELAAGLPVATAASDLDIVVYCPERMTKTQASGLVRALTGRGCAIDVILETPAGGVALCDLAQASDKLLARTPRGSILVADPWAVVVPALEAT
jgi:phosphoribosyl-dephospho-CoA transferase